MKILPVGLAALPFLMVLSPSGASAFSDSTLSIIQGTPDGIVWRQFDPTTKSGHDLASLPLDFSSATVEWNTSLSKALLFEENNSSRGKFYEFDASTSQCRKLPDLLQDTLDGAFYDSTGRVIADGGHQTVDQTKQTLRMFSDRFALKDGAWSQVKSSWMEMNLAKPGTPPAHSENWNKGSTLPAAGSRLPAADPMVKDRALLSKLKRLQPKAPDEKQHQWISLDTKPNPSYVWTYNAPGLYTAMSVGDDPLPKPYIEEIVLASGGTLIPIPLLHTAIPVTPQVRGPYLLVDDGDMTRLYDTRTQKPIFSHASTNLKVGFWP